MRTNRMKRFAGLVFALTVATTTAFSGNNQGRHCIARGRCTSQISNLTAEQKEKIGAMQSEHQKQMDQLRTKRRSTTDLSEKTQIRNEMNAENQNHREKVKSLLTPEQQTQFLCGNQGRGKGQGKGSCSGKGQGKGSGKGQGSGSGSGQGMGNGNARRS